MDIIIRNDLRPGDIGAITWLHGSLYALEYGWDHSFEAYVAAPLAAFALESNPRQRIWVVESDSRVVGSVAIVQASPSEAQLRWLLLHPDVRGLGLGRRLMSEAVEFAREYGYRSLFLWTVSALEAAASLYRANGFAITEESTREIWGAMLTEQRYDLMLSDRSASPAPQRPS